MRQAAKTRYHVYVKGCDSVITWATSAQELPRVILKSFPEYEGLSGYAVDEYGGQVRWARLVEVTS